MLSIIVCPFCVCNGFVYVIQIQRFLLTTQKETDNGETNNAIILRKP